MKKDSGISEINSERWENSLFKHFVTKKNRIREWIGSRPISYYYSRFSSDGRSKTELKKRYSELSTGSSASHSSKSSGVGFNFRPTEPNRNLSRAAVVRNLAQQTEENRRISAQEENTSDNGSSVVDFYSINLIVQSSNISLEFKDIQNNHLKIKLIFN